MRVGIINLTEANFRNSSLNLTNIVEMFPNSAIGGSSKRSRASSDVEIHYGGASPVFTDLAGDKKKFRKRTWIGEFLQIHELNPGDKVVIEQTGPRRYHVYPLRGIN